MKKWILGLALALGIGGLTFAANEKQYVDGGCTFDGNGAVCESTGLEDCADFSKWVCAASAGAAGPRNVPQSAVDSTLGADAVVTVAGVHAKTDHTTQTNHTAGTFDGVYFDDALIIDSKSGTSGHPIIIQPFGWTAAWARTQQPVFLEAMVPLAGGATQGWTQCATCPAGSGAPTGTSCPGVPAAFCTEVWYASSGAFCAGRFEGARTPEGFLTYTVGSPADLTNAHPNYLNKRCSVETWRACVSSADCRGSETCAVSGSAVEIDSYTSNTAKGDASNFMYARWGTGANAPSAATRPYAISQCNGNNLLITGTSSFLEIRGFILKNTRNGMINVTGTAHDITFKDNVLLYSAGNPSGGDYGIVFGAGSVVPGDNLIFRDGEIGFTLSEAVHTSPDLSTTARVRSIINSYIHDMSNGAAANLMGTRPGMTGTCMTLTNAYCRTSACGGNDSCPAGTPCVSFGNYTGSEIAGNVIARCAYLNLENNSYGWLIHDNILMNTVDSGIAFSASNLYPAPLISNSNISVYNNLLVNSGGPLINIGSSGGTSGVLFDSIKIYNNTVYGSAGGIKQAGNVTNAEVRNNIIVSTSGLGVDWPSSNTNNHFDHNLLWKPGATDGTIMANWRGGQYSCNGQGAPSIVGMGGGFNVCADPAFANAAANDFHLLAVSPAIDKGTSIGMPAGRTTDINNTLAELHGLPSYADADPIGGPPEMGVDEIQLSCGNFECATDWTVGPGASNIFTPFVRGCAPAQPMSPSCPIVAGTNPAQACPAALPVCDPGHHCVADCNVDADCPTGGTCIMYPLGAYNTPGHIVVGPLPQPDPTSAVFLAPHSGLSVGLISLETSPSSAYFKETFALNTACTYSLTGYYILASDPGATKPQVTIDTVTLNLATVASKGSSGEYLWTPFPANTFNPLGATSLLTVDGKGSNVGVALYVDDIAVNLVSCP